MAHIPVEDRLKLLDFAEGSGREVVYAYYNPREKELAAHRGESVWPCKIGRTSRADPWDRILEQSGTDGSFQPRLMCFYTDIGFRLETHFHQNCKRVEGALGSEWYLTNPEELKAQYQVFCGGPAPVGGSGPTVRVRVSQRAYDTLKAQAAEKGMDLKAYLDYLVSSLEEDESSDVEARLGALEDRASSPSSPEPEKPKAEALDEDDLANLDDYI
jgi:hypothetical protein